MKAFSIHKTIGAMAALAMAVATVSCDDKLDMGPITQITPDDYYQSDEQLANYVNNYFLSHLQAPFSGAMYHGQGSWNSGLGGSDANTDIYISGSGSTTWFAKKHWQTPSGKALQGLYGNIRVWNHFIQIAEKNIADDMVSGNLELASHYLGEAYFFRALNYYRLLATYGGCAITEEVLTPDDEKLIEASVRNPRNEVARYILSQLDKASTLLLDRSRFNGQRISRQAAQLVKSRVALFEGTFEKYHRGSGRVPGDANWPGAAMAYNHGKTFDIDGEINFFLTECMAAAKEAVGSTQLTPNNKVTEPAYGQTSGWNPYFEMYSQASLADVEEVILWVEYSRQLNVQHSAGYYITASGGCNDGMTRAWAEGFLMTDGLPFYASPLYRGDSTVDKVKTDRDYRLQLFLFGESTRQHSDPANPKSSDPDGCLFGAPHISGTVASERNRTGYSCRKYATYDHSQSYEGVKTFNACPALRTAEAMLNYIEACAELTGDVDATADSYWQALRTRAGVDPDFRRTVAATDLSKERQLSVYSGESPVSPLLFNVRRERMTETFNEGLRFADLIRWRSFDRMMTSNYIPEGVNFWDELYQDPVYDNPSFIYDGSAKSLTSGPEQGKYLRPCSVSLAETNEMRSGYTWTEAYYLSPIGYGDITAASPTREIENSNMYQNVNWSAEGGQYALK